MDGEREPHPTMPQGSGQTVTFWDPPEVMGRVTMWAIALALLLLGIGLGVYLTLIQSDGNTTHGHVESRSTAATR